MFSAFWPEIEVAFKDIKDENEKSEEKYDKENYNSKILEELLELLRTQQKLLNSPNKILPKEYLSHLFEDLQIENSKRRIPNSILPEWKHARDNLINLIYGEKYFGKEFEDIFYAVREFIMVSEKTIDFFI